MKTESTMVETLLNNKILTFIKNMGERKIGRDKKQLNIEKLTDEKRVLLRKWEFQGMNGARFGDKTKIMFFKADLPWQMQVSTVLSILQGYKML